MYLLLTHSVHRGVDGEVTCQFKTARDSKGRAIKDYVDVVIPESAWELITADMQELATSYGPEDWLYKPHFEMFSARDKALFLKINDHLTEADLFSDDGRETENGDEENDEDDM